MALQMEKEIIPSARELFDILGNKYVLLDTTKQKKRTFSLEGLNIGSVKEIIDFSHKNTSNKQGEASF